MTEKKTVWAVTRNLEIKEKVAIFEDGKILAAKDVDASDLAYNGNECQVKIYSATKDQAEEWIEKTKAETREMVTTVRKFIERMDVWWNLREVLDIKKKDYLGRYADCDNGNQDSQLNEEREYAKKLETFIHSRRLDIDGHMVPIDDVKDVQWYGYENAEEYEPGVWKAVLTTRYGDIYTTCSENDVRLIWATIGKVSGSWYIDNDIDYDNNDSSDE
jgi:hypothetical protein